MIVQVRARFHVVQPAKETAISNVVITAKQRAKGLVATLVLGIAKENVRKPVQTIVRKPVHLLVINIVVKIVLADVHQLAMIIVQMLVKIIVHIPAQEHVTQSNYYASNYHIHRHAGLPTEVQVLLSRG